MYCFRFPGNWSTTHKMTITQIQTRNQSSLSRPRIKRGSVVVCCGVSFKYVHLLVCCSLYYVELVGCLFASLFFGCGCLLLFLFELVNVSLLEHLRYYRAKFRENKKNPEHSTSMPRLIARVLVSSVKFKFSNDGRSYR